MGGLPSEEFFGNLMTWSALEDAVRGLRDTTTPAAVVEKTEASNQTDPVSTERVRERGVNIGADFRFEVPGQSSVGPS